MSRKWREMGEVLAFKRPLFEAKEKSDKVPVL